jgi:hypothetical protein
MNFIYNILIYLFEIKSSTIRFKTNFKNCVLDGLRKR